MDEILDFLEKAEASGQTIPTVIGPQVDINGEISNDNNSNTVSYEARQLKNVFLKLYDA